MHIPRHNILYYLLSVSDKTTIYTKNLLISRRFAEKLFEVLTFDDNGGIMSARREEVNVMMFQYFNGKDTSNRDSGSISWLERYMRYHDLEDTPLCASCFKQAEVGGHLSKKPNDKTGPYWIAPLCKQCNNQPSDVPLFIFVSDDFVREEKLLNLTDK